VEHFIVPLSLFTKLEYNFYMKIVFSIANNNAIKFYLLGLSSNHHFFSFLNKEQKKNIRKLFKNPHNLDLPGDYDVYKILKSSILKNKSQFPDFIDNYLLQLEKITLVKDLDKKAIRVKKQLQKEYSKYKEKIIEFFDKNKIEQQKKFWVYIMPGMGEGGELLDNTIVIGDGSDIKVLFAILLEEILHALISIPDYKIFNLTKSKKLFEEAYIGFWLYKLLKYINYNKEISESVVFGWGNRKREKIIEKLIKINPK